MGAGLGILSYLLLHNRQWWLPSLKDKEKTREGKKKIRVSHQHGAVPDCITVTPERFTTDSLMSLVCVVSRVEKNDQKKSLISTNPAEMTHENEEPTRHEALLARCRKEIQMRPFGLRGR